MCRWGCTTTNTTYMCKWCGTRYCRECLHGDFVGLMKESTHCRICNQKRCQGNRVEYVPRAKDDTETDGSNKRGSRSASRSRSAKSSAKSRSKSAKSSRSKSGKKSGKKKKKKWPTICSHVQGDQVTIGILVVSEKKNTMHSDMLLKVDWKKIQKQKCIGSSVGRT